MRVYRRRRTRLGVDVWARGVHGSRWQARRKDTAATHFGDARTSGAAAAKEDASLSRAKSMGKAWAQMTVVRRGVDVEGAEDMRHGGMGSSAPPAACGNTRHDAARHRDTPAAGARWGTVHKAKGVTQDVKGEVAMTLHAHPRGAEHVANGASIQSVGEARSKGMHDAERRRGSGWGAAPSMQRLGHERCMKRQRVEKRMSKTRLCRQR